MYIYSSQLPGEAVTHLWKVEHIIPFSKEPLQLS